MRITKGSTFLFALTLLPAASGATATKKPEHNPDLIGARDVGKGVNFYSMEREIGLGREMAQETERQAKMLDDGPITEYVNGLVQNLAHHSDARIPFTVKVVDSDEVNAFALPGGFMYVNSGLLLRAENEAELAAVLSHEIAHVAARHGTRQATRGQLINLSTIPLLFAGGWAGYAVRQAAALAIPAGFLKFSRNMEAEADLLGLQYMYKSGYDPVEFVNFFERIQTLEKGKPGAVSKLFSTHPMTGSRIRAAQREIQEDLKTEAQYVVDTSAFHSARLRLIEAGNRVQLKDGSGGPVLHTRPSTRIETAEDPRRNLKRPN